MSMWICQIHGYTNCNCCNKAELVTHFTEYPRSLEKRYITEMPDGTKWAVPVSIIALNRAKCYALEFDGSIAKSLSDDTLPLFESDDDEIEDWAKNNMNWSDVKEDATMVNAADICDYQDGWVNGDVEIA